jgi:hypothetical protein
LLPSLIGFASMTDSLRLILAAILAATFLLVDACTARAADALALNAARESITATELKQHVETLSDDTFEGREAGSRGGRAAGGYLVKLLEQYALKGAGDKGSFYQSFGNGYRNILATLEGSDPELRQQVILVGAHYDHVGYGNATNSYGPIGYIHNGADDNASGVAALLELIDAYRKLPEPPPRTILFAFWDGEEKGLLGSEHWAQRPTVPLSRVRTAINLDMIGRLRNQRLTVFGTRTAAGLRRLISDQNRGSELALDYSWEMASNSDHYTFFSRGLTTLMLHTGLHDNYHRPSDDLETVNLEGMQQVSRLLFNVTHALADAPELTGFRPESRSETEFAQLRFERALQPLPPRLGVRWKPPEAAANAAQSGVSPRGLELVQVTAGSAADRAGIRAGDLLVGLDGRPITGQDEFTSAVVTAASPITLAIERAGQEPLEIEVALDGRPVRVGLNWRDDPAEPGTVMLTRVVPGSPAARAGLAPRDRLYAVAGEPIGNTTRLGELLTTLPSPLELTIERDGRIQTVSVEVAPAAEE